MDTTAKEEMVTYSEKLFLEISDLKFTEKNRNDYFSYKATLNFFKVINI